MQAPQKFKTRGFIVLYGTVPGGMVDQLRNGVRHNKNLGWFSDVFDGGFVDEHRIQAPIPDPTSRELTRTLKRYYKTFFPKSQPTDWRFLMTRGGSLDQPARRDFLPPVREEELMNVCAFPGSILIATEEDTFFYGFGWNHYVGLKSNRQLITLGKGDIIMFRGDFIYAPVGYKANNLCVHAYLDPAEYERPEVHQPHALNVIGDTRGVDDPFSFVWNCGIKGESMNSARNHLNRFHHFRFNENGAGTRSRSRKAELCQLWK